MSTKQARSSLAALSVFLGLVYVIIGIGFVAWHPQSHDSSGETVELDEESYLEQDKNRNESVSSGQSGRRSIFDPPGYELSSITKELPWTWDTCGLKNTSEEIGRAERQEGRVWPGTSQPVHRGLFPWYLIIFGGERDEKLKENNGWIDHGGGGCGASLISGHHGLSAAHCYCEEMANQRNDPDKKRKIYVAAGLKNTFEVTEPAFVGSWRLITDCAEHPAYRGSKIDFSVLTWEGDPYKFIKNEKGIIVINTVCVNLPTTINYGTRMEFVGNGYNDGYYRWYGWTYSFWILCYGLPIWPSRYQLIHCRQKPAQDGAVCFGDSGGPLTSALHPREPNRWYQTGALSAYLLSSGHPGDDCRNGLAILYYRPDAVTDFIKRHVHDG